MPGVVYLITNLVNRKVYVGQTSTTLAERWIDHCRKQVRTPLQKAIRKYGRAAFEMRTLRQVETPEELDAWESIYIQMLSSHLRECGYNRTLGGAGASVNEETRAKKRDASLGAKNPFFGRHHSAETRARWSMLRRGRKQTDAYMEKMKGRFVGEANPFFGKKHSAETRETIRQKGMGSQNAKGHKCPNPFAKGHGELRTPEGIKRSIQALLQHNPKLKKAKH